MSHCITKFLHEVENKFELVRNLIDIESKKSISAFNLSRIQGRGSNNTNIIEMEDLANFQFQNNFYNINNIGDKYQDNIENNQDNQDTLRFSIEDELKKLYDKQEMEEKKGDEEVKKKGRKEFDFTLPD